MARSTREQTKENATKLVVIKPLNQLLFEGWKLEERSLYLYSNNEIGLTKPMQTILGTEIIAEVYFDHFCWAGYFFPLSLIQNPLEEIVFKIKNDIWEK
jgi:hypothetical protein